MWVLYVCARVCVCVCVCVCLTAGLNHRALRRMCVYVCVLVFEFQAARGLQKGWVLFWCMVVAGLQEHGNQEEVHECALKP